MWKSGRCGKAGGGSGGCGWSGDDVEEQAEVGKEVEQ